MKKASGILGFWLIRIKVYFKKFSGVSNNLTKLMSESSSGWLPSRNFGLQKFRRYKKRFQKRFVHQLLRKQNTQDSIYLNSGLIAFKVFELQWLSYSARDFH